MLTADAQCVIPTDNLQADIPFFTKTLNMRMETIYPADDPTVAVFSGHGISICIDKDALGKPAFINLLVDTPKNLQLAKQSSLHQMELNLKLFKKTHHSFYQKLSMNLSFGVW